VFAQKGKLFSSPLQAAGHSNGAKAENDFFKWLWSVFEKNRGTFFKQ